MPTVNALFFYTRADCELCDQAEALLASCRHVQQWRLYKVDIDSDPALVDKYGWSIPVLKREGDGAELYWPFPPSRLRDFLQARVSETPKASGQA